MKSEALGEVVYLKSLEEEMGGADLTEEHVDRYIYEVLASGVLQLQHPFVYLMNAHG